MNDLEKAMGIIFGLAVGDALDWPTEFLFLSKIKFKRWRIWYFRVIGNLKIPLMIFVF